MTKKLLGLMIVALLCTGVASALSFSEAFCDTYSYTNTTGSQAVPSSFGPATGSCSNFTVPAGDTLTSVVLTIQNGFSNSYGTSNTATFTYSFSGNLNTDLGTITSQVSGSTQDSAWAFNGGCSNVGDVATCTDSSPSTTAGVFQLAPVGISGAWSGSGGLNPNGTWDSNFSITFNYQSSGTPEPASLLLVGGGLIGLAFAGRRKFRA